MKPLFRIDPNCSTPIPVLALDPDNSPREADSRMYFTADDAAAATGLTAAELVEFWHASMKDYIDAPSETASSGSSDIATASEFGSPPDAKVLEQVRRPQSGHLTADEMTEFKTKARALGYDVDKRQCYPRRITNEDTGQTEIVVLAKIEVLEERVMRSGLFDGTERYYRGPEGGEWLESWSSGVPPHEALVRMYRKGLTRPVVVSGLWLTFAKLSSPHRSVRTASQHWHINGAFMLVKCLRAQAMRELFRDVIGNIYISEELPTPSSARSGTPDVRAR